MLKNPLNHSPTNTKLDPPIKVAWPWSPLVVWIDPLDKQERTARRASCKKPTPTNTPKDDDVVHKIGLSVESETIWWPAAVIPTRDIKGDWSIAPHRRPRHNELYVRYFEDNTFSIVLEADIQVFTGTDPLFLWFKKRNPLELESNNGVRRALRFVHYGILSPGFLWDKWKLRCMELSKSKFEMPVFGSSPPPEYSSSSLEDDDDEVSDLDDDMFDLPTLPPLAVPARSPHPGSPLPTVDHPPGLVPQLPPTLASPSSREPLAVGQSVQSPCKPVLAVPIDCAPPPCPVEMPVSPRISPSEPAFSPRPPPADLLPDFLAQSPRVALPVAIPPCVLPAVSPRTEEAGPASQHLPTLSPLRTAALAICPDFVKRPRSRRVSLIKVPPPYTTPQSTPSQVNSPTVPDPPPLPLGPSTTSTPDTTLFPPLTPNPELQPPELTAAHTPERPTDNHDLTHSSPARSVVTTRNISARELDQLGKFFYVADSVNLPPTRKRRAAQQTASRRPTDCSADTIVLPSALKRARSTSSASFIALPCRNYSSTTDDDDVLSSAPASPDLCRFRKLSLPSSFADRRSTPLRRTKNDGIVVLPSLPNLRSVPVSMRSGGSVISLPTPLPGPFTTNNLCLTDKSGSISARGLPASPRSTPVDLPQLPKPARVRKSSVTAAPPAKRPALDLAEPEPVLLLTKHPICGTFPRHLSHQKTVPSKPTVQLNGTVPPPSNGVSCGNGEIPAMTSVQRSAKTTLINRVRRCLDGESKTVLVQCINQRQLLPLVVSPGNLETNAPKSCSSSQWIRLRTTEQRTCAYTSCLSITNDQAFDSAVVDEMRRLQAEAFAIQDIAQGLGGVAGCSSNGFRLDKDGLGALHLQQARQSRGGLGKLEDPVLLAAKSLPSTTSPPAFPNMMHGDGHCERPLMATPDAHMTNKEQPLVRPTSTSPRGTLMMMRQPPDALSLPSPPQPLLAVPTPWSNSAKYVPYVDLQYPTSKKTFTPSSDQGPPATSGITSKTIFPRLHPPYTRPSPARPSACTDPNPYLLSANKGRFMPPTYHPPSENGHSAIPSVSPVLFPAASSVLSSAASGSANRFESGGALLVSPLASACTPTTCAALESVSSPLQSSSIVARF